MVVGTEMAVLNDKGDNNFVTDFTLATEVGTVSTDLCAHPWFQVFAQCNGFERGWHARSIRFAMGT
jgi:hypothetical protein